MVMYSNITVDYKDHMGDDLSVVDAARVSFDKESKWVIKCHLGDGCFCVTKDPKKCFNAKNFLSEGDTKLIKYLAEHNHWSPFGHCQAKFRVKAPIFLARQLVKHQVGLVWNEISRRYVDSQPEFYHPESWRGRPVGGMKQGSNEDVEITHINFEQGESIETNAAFKLLVDSSLTLYNSMVNSGVAPEQARMVLPQNMMVEWIWTGSLMAWARVYGLRSKPTAQKEARDFASLLHAEINGLFPESWAALTGTKS